jgi:acetylornithine/N-succinyldiaminopimelate aminotransferase
MPHLMNTYGRLPVAFTHGQGCRLFDEQGKSYLDALAGIAVNTLGHNHPRLVKALSAQVGRLMHASNLYRIGEAEAASDRLAALSRHGRGVLLQFRLRGQRSGDQAGAHVRPPEGHRAAAIIVMEQAFHGRTLATLSATGNRKVQAGFEPLVPGFVRVPFDDIAAIEQVAERNPNVVAVLFEPIQGEGGINIAHKDFMRRCGRSATGRAGLFMVDEVQCGIGRTGAWFAHQHAGIRPDVMTLAKGLGSGVPIGACLAAGAPPACSSRATTAPPSAATRWPALPPDHARRHRSRGLMARATRWAKPSARAAEALAGVAGVVEVRGDGLMIGIELDRPCGDLVKRALEPAC